MVINEKSVQIHIRKINIDAGNITMQGSMPVKVNMLANFQPAQDALETKSADIQQKQEQLGSETDQSTIDQLNQEIIQLQSEINAIQERDFKVVLSLVVPEADRELFIKNPKKYVINKYSAVERS